MSDNTDTVPARIDWQYVQATALQAVATFIGTFMVAWAGSPSITIMDAVKTGSLMAGGVILRSLKK